MPRIIDSVLVYDDGPDKSTERVPVAAVTRQSRRFDREYGTDPAFADRCQQALEAWPIDADAGAAKIIVDDFDCSPAELPGTIGEPVLTVTALEIVQSAQRVRTKEARIEPNARYPLANQPGALSRCDRLVPTATAAEEEIAWLLAGGSDVIVDRFTGLLRHLKLDGLAGLFLTHGCSVDRVTMRRNVLHPQADDVAASELAIDGEIEHGQVACSPCDLQFGSDRPDVLRPKRRLGTNQLVFIPGFAT